MKSVFSSSVSRIGWNSETNELWVEWSGGRVSAYGGVSQEQADEIANSWSVGEAVARLKKSAPHRYIR